MWEDFFVMDTFKAFRDNVLPVLKVLREVLRWVLKISEVLKVLKLLEYLGEDL